MHGRVTIVLATACNSAQQWSIIHGWCLTAHKASLSGLRPPTWIEAPCQFPLPLAASSNGTYFDTYANVRMTFDMHSRTRRFNIFNTRTVPKWADTYQILSNTMRTKSEKIPNEAVDCRRRKRVRLKEIVHLEGRDIFRAGSWGK